MCFLPRCTTGTSLLALPAAPAEYNFDVPEAFDSQLLMECLAALKAVRAGPARRRIRFLWSGSPARVAGSWCVCWPSRVHSRWLDLRLLPFTVPWQGHHFDVPVYNFTTHSRRRAA